MLFTLRIRAMVVTSWPSVAHVVQAGTALDRRALPPVAVALRVNTPSEAIPVVVRPTAYNGSSRA